MRKLALLTSLVIAAMAMTTTTAFAAIEVTDPETGEPCSEVSPAINAGNANVKSTGYTYASGGCTVSMVSSGNVPIRYSDYTSGTANCQMTFEAHIGPDGWGYATDFTYNNGALSCGVWQACAGSRVIAPADYNPNIWGSEPSFPFADGDTDLNVSMCAHFSSYGAAWGLNSIDLGEDGLGNTTWTNQQTGGYLFQNWRFTGGTWEATTSHPIVTQL